MEKPESPVDSIIMDYNESLHLQNPHPVVFGELAGKYSVAELNELEAELQKRLRVKRVTLGKAADRLIYMIDNRIDNSEVSATE